MGRAVWDGLTARLMFAGRNRRRALRSKLPLTSDGSAGWGHSADGDRCCSGGRPAHGEGLVWSLNPVRRNEQNGHERGL